MTGALRAEIRKILSTRLWWVLGVCVLVLGAAYAAYPGLVALAAGQANDALPPLGEPGLVRSVYNGGNTVTRVLALVLGVVAAAGEYRHRTLAAGYLATPRRLRWLAAKSLAAGLFGLAYGVVSALAGLVVGIIVVHQRSGAATFLDQPATWRSLLLHVVSLGLWAVLGVGLGTVVANLPVAVVVGVAAAFVVEPLAAWLLRRSGLDLALGLIPTGATNALLGDTAPVLLAAAHPFAWWVGGLVLAGWCLLPVVIAAVTTMRRDVL